MPLRPRSGLPSQTTPVPMPVPSVTMTMLSTPRPAPCVHSPSAAARASFSNNSGRPMAFRAQPARSSRGASSNLPKVPTTFFPSGLMMHGSAQARARTGSAPASAAAIFSIIPCKSGSICASEPCRGVSRICSSRIWPPRTRPALQRVPPKSIAITLISDEFGCIPSEGSEPKTFRPTRKRGAWAVLVLCRFHALRTSVTASLPSLHR